VHHHIRDTRRRAFLAFSLVAVFCAAPLASAEIFKCVAKDESPLYQNFACHIDSLGSLPSNPPVAKTPSMPGNAGKEKPRTEPINVASSVKSTYKGEPRIGMTSDEVKVLLGEPEEMVEDEPARGGRVSMWRYADGRSVQFDNKHRVLAVQR
jgi:hypothetical protein